MTKRITINASNQRRWFHVAWFPLTTQNLEVWPQTNQLTVKIMSPGKLTFFQKNHNNLLSQTYLNLWYCRLVKVYSFWIFRWSLFFFCYSQLYLIQICYLVSHLSIPPTFNGFMLRTLVFNRLRIYNFNFSKLFLLRINFFFF